MSRNDVPAFPAARLNLQEDAAYAMLSDTVYASHAELVAAGRGQGTHRYQSAGGCWQRMRFKRELRPDIAACCTAPSSKRASRMRPIQPYATQTKNLANKRDLACL